MGEQQSTSRLSVVLSALAVVVALAAFAGAFYYYDGVALVSGMLDGFSGGSRPTASGSTPATQSVPPELGKDIPEEFALRLWQEQVDSQPMIQRLVDGDIRSMKVTRVESASAEATIGLQVTLKNGTKVDGALGLSRFKDSWFVAFASLERNGVIERPKGPLPDLEEVDAALLNTMFEQQYGAANVIDEYLSGVVQELAFETPQRGPNTMTIDVEMDETHGEGYAQVVAVEQEIDGKKHWFLVRFTKTGHDPEEPS